MDFTTEDLAMFASGTEVFMAIVGEDGQVKKSNNKWYKKLHVTKEEFQKRPIFEFVHSNDREAFKQALSQLRGNQQLCHYLIQFVDKELASYTFQFDLTYKNKLIYLVGFDVTDHYQEHQSLQEMSSMAKVGAWYYNPIKDETYWTDECYRIHDLAPGGPIDVDTALGFYVPRDREKIDEHIKKLYEEQAPYDFVGEIVTSKGNKKWIRTQASPIVHDGKLIFIYGITADQTRLHRNLLKLKNDAETMDLALKGIKSGLFDYDVESDLMFISPEFKKMLGLPEGEDRLKGTRLIELIHPEDREEALGNMVEGLKEEGNHHFNRYRLKLGNGEYNHYEVYGWRKKEGEKTVRMVGNLINVHDRVLIQQERTRIMNSLEAMVDNGFIYSMLLDKEGVILIADQRTIEIIKHDYDVDPRQEEVKYVDVMPDVFKRTFLQEFKTALEGKTVRKEVERPLLDGSMQWLDIMYRPIRNDTNEIVFVLTNLMDVTERKKAELSVKEAEMKANQLNELKSEVLSNLSHEIRTPLNGIMGVNELLTKDCNEEQKDLLAKQKESSVRLLKTLTDMIVLSNQYSIKQSMKAVHLDANSLIRTCHEMYVHMANLKKLHFEFVPSKKSPKLFVDREMFIASLGAIINNALKYTDKGKVTVSCKKNAEQGHTEICVEDTGKGIDTKDFGKIFDVPDEGKIGLYKKFEKSGIGLGTTKKYIETMGGSIRVVSSLGKGSEFIITMPSE